jgi:hypothetical protein
MAVEKCSCVSGKSCCDQAGCGGLVEEGKRFFWVEEEGAENGDLEHRLCRDCVSGK